MVRIGHKGIRNQARLKSFGLKFILTTTPTVRIPLSAASVSNVISAMHDLNDAVI